MLPSDILILDVILLLVMLNKLLLFSVLELESCLFVKLLSVQSLMEIWLFSILLLDDNVVLGISLCDIRSKLLLLLSWETMSPELFKSDGNVVQCMRFLYESLLWFGFSQPEVSIYDSLLGTTLRSIFSDDGNVISPLIQGGNSGFFTALSVITCASRTSIWDLLTFSSWKL